MKNKATRFRLMMMVISILLILSCNSPSNKVKIELEGPIYGEVIVKKFRIDSTKYFLDTEEFYFAKLTNNYKSTIKIGASDNDQIFPDSIRYHTYEPYSSENKSWNKSIQEKPTSSTYLQSLRPGESKLFWFLGKYDHFLDLINVHFTIVIEDKMENLIVQKQYINRQKASYKYTLYKVDSPKEIEEISQVDINVDGPFSYKETNKLLSKKIPVTNDGKEVFIFDIKNNWQENLYIERWANDEINMDTIYSYAPFTQTSKKYLWTEFTNNKVERPLDTIVLKPQESYKFWDSFNRIWQTTDSIVFNKTFRTDEFLIQWSSKFEIGRSF
jgi:hypothetical protein